MIVAIAKPADIFALTAYPAAIGIPAGPNGATEALNAIIALDVSVITLAMETPASNIAAAFCNLIFFPAIPDN